MPCKDLVIARIGDLVEVLHVNLIVISPIAIQTSLFRKCIPKERKEPVFAQVRGGVPVELPCQGCILHIISIGDQQGICALKYFLPSDPVDGDDKKMP
jgi:hypothetical protein